MSSRTLLAEPEMLLLDPSEEEGRLELRLEFVELRAKGWSYRKISSRLKVSKSTLANWSQELEQEISSLKAMELEALYERYYLLKEGRIRLLGAMLKKIRSELASRDFSNVPTDKLLDLLLRYEEAMQAEYTEPRPLSSQEISDLRDRTGTRLDSEAIAMAMEDLLQRYKSGLVDVKEAREEISLLLAILKAEEQTVIEAKLERVEAILDDRRQHGN